MRVIGFESANSYVKVKSEEREEAYPNVLWRVPEDFQANIMSNGKREKVYQIGDEKFQAGVRWKGYRSSSGTSADRYSLPQYKNETLIALARHAVDNDDLNIVTAVPAIHYNNPEVHRTIEKVLKDVHAVRVDDSPLIFTVKKVRAILQPVAMVISTAFNADGSIRTPVMLKSRKVVIDIGWGTTDVAVMNGLDLVEAIPVEVAMMNAYNRIDKQIRHDYPRLKSEPFKLLDLEEQLRDSDLFSWGNGSVDCSKIKEKAFQATAQEIIAEITNRIQLTEYDMTLFGGGGIEALKKFMKPQLEGINAQQVTNPQLANALGCYIYGKFKK